MAGFGAAPFGVAPYGIGTPATAPVPGGVVNRDPLTGKSLDSRYIDPRTGQYSFDSYGRAIGMTTARQLVLLRLHTERRSSALKDLGNDLRSLDRITTNFDKRVQAIVESALADIIQSKIIALLEVTTVIPKPSAAYVRVRFRDLTTNTEDEVKVQ